MTAGRHAGDHDPAVRQAAAEAGLRLEPRQTRVFDEVLDIVAADLVLVLDHFDLTEARTTSLAA